MKKINTNWDFVLWLVIATAVLIWLSLLVSRVSAESLYAPTPLPVVEKMLEVAKIKKTDIVYDLGSGDGRLVIMASAIYGCRSVGIERDERLVERSRANVRRNSRVIGLISIQQQDILETNLGEADVVLLYLMPDLLTKLRPKFVELKDGVRLVAHDKPIPGVSVDDEFTMKVKGTTHTVFSYVLPLREMKCAGGT